MNRRGLQFLRNLAGTVAKVGALALKEDSLTRTRLTLTEVNEWASRNGYATASTPGQLLIGKQR